MFSQYIDNLFSFLQTFPSRNVVSVKFKVSAYASCAQQPPEQPHVSSGKDVESEDDALSRSTSVSDSPLSIPVATLLSTPAPTAAVLMDTRPKKSC